MRYPAAETAERHRRLLQVAAYLFRERGFDAVSVSEVMKAAGMTHGAFYSHFESKDELTVAALEEAMAQSGGLLDAALSNPDTAKAVFLEGYLDAEHRDGMATGCPMTALAVEVGRRGAGKAAFSAHLLRVLDRVVNGFRWSRRGPARDQALLMLSATVGAVILARAVDDPELSDEILAATRRQLAAA